MVNFLEGVLVLIIIGLLVAVWKLYKDKKESEKEAALAEKEKDEYAELGKGLAEYNQKLQEKKNQVKEKILELFETKLEISNRDVAKKLALSRASAFRYLDELEKEGKLKQVGKTGRNAFYTKISA